MRKTFAFIVTSLDGYYEGPGGAFDWPVVDDEFNEFAIDQLEEIGTIVFGRNTYLGMAAHWPTEQAQRDDPTVAKYMNELPKAVVSKSLPSADWANTTLLRSADELVALREQDSKALAVFGSSALSASLLELGLLDELRIMVHPVLLGGGESLLHTLADRRSVRLTASRVFDSGNVLLTYQPT